MLSRQIIGEIPLTTGQAGYRQISGKFYIIFYPIQNLLNFIDRLMVAIGRKM